LPFYFIRANLSSEDTNYEVIVFHVRAVDIFIKAVVLLCWRFDGTRTWTLIVPALVLGFFVAIDSHMTGLGETRTVFLFIGPITSQRSKEDNAGKEKTILEERCHHV